MAHRTSAAIPLLFLGLAMAIYPAGFVQYFRLLNWAVRNFSYRLRHEEWLAQMDRPDDSPDSPQVALGIRLAGAALCLFGVVVLAGR